MTKFSVLEVAIMAQFGEYATIHRRVHGGIHIMLEFPNHFAASFINHRGSQGNEIAIIKDGVIDGSTILSKSTIISSDDGILGYLTEEEVMAALIIIKNLQPDGQS